jgi:xanthine dehydrogenase/oxidase
MARALTNADGVYNIPNYRAVGKVCLTSLPSNTAFRGFGAPQAMMITEQWMERVAEYLKLPSEQVKVYTCFL